MCKRTAHASPVVFLQTLVFHNDTRFVFVVKLLLFVGRERHLRNVTSNSFLEIVADKLLASQP